MAGITRMIFSTTNRPNYTNLFCPAALELCSLATGGTQEIAEGLARRPEGESQIAEISKGTQIPQIAQKFGHHRWQGYIYKSHRNRRNSGKEPSQMATYWNRLKARNYTKLYSKLNKIEGAITDG